jgi:hypothetical protein
MNQSELIEAVVRELKKAISLYETSFYDEKEKDPFIRGCHYGYLDGMKRAIEIVNLEIGLRQDPPNINYPGERPQ